MKRSVLAALLAVGLTTTAHAQTFSNPGTIAIPAAGTSGVSAPYPSTIGVVGGPASITSISVRLNLTHTFSADIDVLLVGPGGQTVTLMSDIGGGTNLNSATFTFTSAPGTPASNDAAFSPGTYAPTNLFLIGADAFPVPAPAGPYGADFASFMATNANGTWSLYVVDDAGADVGAVNGWSITFNESVSGITPTSNIFTYQGKLTAGSTPVNGNVDLRFSFWRDQFSTSPGNSFGPSPTLTNVPVVDGLFTVQVDAGNEFFDNRELWLEIAVRNPAGGGAYTTLTGRQRVTPSPAAQYASNALNATNAASADTADVATAALTVTSPNGATPLITTSNSGQVFMGGATTGIGAGTLILNGAQGTGSGSYGGMYITTPHAEGLPFYGYSTSAMACWTYLDPADSMWRHSWGVNLNTSGNMGIGSDPVAGFKLAVNGALRCVGFTNASSQRYKTDVAPLSPVLDRFERLQPVSFVWGEQAPESVRGHKDVGLIAEEVYKLFPDAVSLDGQGRPDGIDYGRVTALSIQRSRRCAPPSRQRTPNSPRSRHALRRSRRPSPSEPFTEKHTMKTLTHIARAAAPLLVACPLAAARGVDPPAITWWTIDAGGGTSTGGGLTLSGTVGQPDASNALTGGGLRLVGGFWGAFTPDLCGPADMGGTGGVPPGDGHLDNNDFVVFIDYFFSHNTLADVGSTGGVPPGDGAWDNNDFVVFIDLFFAGCP